MRARSLVAAPLRWVAAGLERLGWWILPAVTPADVDRILAADPTEANARAMRHDSSQWMTNRIERDLALFELTWPTYRRRGWRRRDALAHYSRVSQEWLLRDTFDLLRAWDQPDDSGEDWKADV